MNVVILGLVWGDESKGRIADYLVKNFKWAVRFNGSCNSGRTVVTDDGQKTVLRHLPCGILHKDIKCVLGQGMVIDPLVLYQELKETKFDCNNLYISNNAHITMPYHVELDKTRSLSKDLGTTNKGVGLAYESKVRRTGIRAKDLKNPKILADKLDKDIAGWVPEMRALGLEIPKTISIMSQLNSANTYVYSNRICDTATLLNKTNESILFEGAQSTLLSLDSDDYPFVTSSSATIGGVLTGAGVSHKKIDKVIGVAKFYSTKVGTGEMANEIHDETADKIRMAGKEFGSVTGRPRRIGWLNTQLLNKTISENGVDSLALTKLDVLSCLEKIRIWVDDRNCIEYSSWNEDISNCRKFEDLPANARKFVDGVQKQILPCQIEYISVGPKRSEMIDRTYA